MAIETKPGTTERSNLTPEVLDRFGILFIDLSNENLTGTSSDARRFVEALRISSDRLKTINGIIEELPLTVPESGIIIGGSNHSVYEELPWMARLQEFIRSMAEQQKPILGVCFGHQIVAAALGGTVEKGSKGPEFGAIQVMLTQEGQNDPLYRGLPSTLTVAMTHGDVVTKLSPDTGTVLATNSTYHNQSLAFGSNIRTTQFHPEMTGGTLAAIAAHDGVKSREALRSLRDTDVTTHGQAVLGNFLDNFVRPYHTGGSR